MNNTKLQLNVYYTVIPYDGGYRFVEEAKTNNPLIPDDVIIRLLELKSMAQNRFADFNSMYSRYLELNGCYMGIPCPDIEGYSFNLTFKEGKIDSFKVCCHEQ